MKRVAKNGLCILLAMCFLNVSVFATEAVQANGMDSMVQPRFTYIIECSVGILIEPDGCSYSDTGVTLYESTHSARIDMTLQRFEGTGWEDVKSWSYTDDGPNIDIEERWYVVPGYDYRVESDIYVYNANGRLIESTTETSPTWEYYD